MTLDKKSVQHASSLTSIEEIQQALEQLTKEEEEVTERLEWTIGNRHHLEAKLSNLAHLVPTLQLVEADARKLANTIAFTNQLANGVSARVRQLDLAKSRVSEVQKSVGDLLDLEGCAGGVSLALSDEDYEQAAAHINRFLSMDEAVLRHSAGATNEGQNMDTWFERLRNAESKLKTIINEHFDSAVSNKDHASIERFFKLFPLVNEHETGLQKFSHYLCLKVHQKNETNLQNAKTLKPTAKRSHIIWADTLTLLLEEIARTVEVNQPIIETYYKPGYLHIVLKSLQTQCDVEACQLISEMKKNRNLDAIISAVEMSSRPISQGVRENIIPEPKNLDTLLGELTLMSARSELYLRFLRRRVTGDYEASIVDDALRVEQIRSFDSFLSQSQLSCNLAVIIGSYSLLEKHYLNESFKKAVAMDTTELSQLTSSIVDDSFYIIKKCVRRAIASSNVDGVCIMLNHSVDLLETQLANRFHQNLRKGFPVQGYTDFTQAYSALQLSLPSRKSTLPNELEDSRQLFLTALNNAATSILHVANLQQSLSENIKASFSDLSMTSKAKLDSCLVDLSHTSKKFQTVVDFGLSQMQATAIKPKLKPWVDSLASISHDISEDQFASYEANDPFSENLMVQLDGLLASFSGLLTPENHKTLVNSLIQEVALQMEKTVMKMAFSRLGGLHFDRVIRALSAYLSRVSEWSVREQLMRLSQMATLLNLENLSEVSEYAGNANWRLTPLETKKVLQLRVDLKYEEIQKLRI